MCVREGGWEVSCPNQKQNKNRKQNQETGDKERERTRLRRRRLLGTAVLCLISSCSRQSIDLI